MRKITVSSYGGPESLVLTEAAAPVPGAGQLLVRVEAAGVNYVDIHQRRGEFPVPTPFTPGLEGFGVVTAIGTGVTGVKTGDRVAWLNVLGSYAEQHLVPAAQAIVLPKGFTAEKSLLLQAMTAEYLVHEYRQIRAGDIALVHAAAGGVGQLLVQWFKHLGATVIGTASSEDKLKTVRALGVDVAINYADGKFADAVRDATKGHGVDVAYDAVGKATLLDTIGSLAPLGTVVSFGAASGPAPPVDPNLLTPKSARLATGALFMYVADPKELRRRAQVVLAAIKEGWLRPAPARSYALADAAKAHRDIESRATQGKLYLVP
jgi:NADPH:quinone reductase